MSKLGVEILSIRELVFRSQFDNITKINAQKNKNVDIQQKVEITIMHLEKKQLRVIYTLDAEITRKTKREKVKPLFEFITMVEFQLEDFSKVKRNKKVVEHIEEDLLRLLISVTVGTTRGLLLGKSSSLPSDFIVPIIDLETIVNPPKKDEN